MAGGGSVAAMQIAELNGTCTFFTAVGNDEVGKRAIEQLQHAGVEVHAAVEKTVQTKNIIVHIDDQNERTITVVGNVKPRADYHDLPWDKLAQMDAVYFVSGDAAALAYARRARSLVSTARISPMLRGANILVDALVTSASDAGERYSAGDITPEPKMVVTTRGKDGGSVCDGTQYKAELVAPASVVDSYGCGDSFAAGLTYGLASGMANDNALKIAAKAGSTALQRRGAFGN